MALETQLVELPFQSGLAEKTYGPYVEVGSQTSIINGVFSKAGAIHKRSGYAALSKTYIGNGGGTMGSLAYLTSLGAGVVAIDGSSTASSNLYTYSSTLGKFSYQDKIGECNAWRDSVSEWTAATTSFDVAYGSGLIVEVWCALPRNSTTKHTVYANVIDWTTGAYLYTNYEVASAPSTTDYPYARVIVQGTTAMVVYQDATAGTDIYAIPFDLSAGTWGSATKVVSDADTGVATKGFWDICPIVGGTDWIILYAQQTGAAHNSRVRRLTTANATVSSSALFAGPGAYLNPGHGYAVCADTTRVWHAIVYDDGANEKVHAGTHATSGLAVDVGETATNITFTGTGDIKIGMCLSSTTTAVITSGNASTAVGTLYDVMTWSAGVLTPGTLVHEIFGVFPASKPFRQCGQTYVVVGSLWNLVAYQSSPPVATSSPQGAYILMELNETLSTSSYIYAARPVANLGPRVANTTNSAVQTMNITPGAWAVSSTRWVSIGSIVRSTSNRFGLEVLTFDFAGDRWSGAELGGVRYMAGGIPSVFDGQRVTEMGFLHPPPTLALVEGAAGSMTAGGTYTYLACYFWTDALGQIQRSASSIGSITLGAGKTSVTVTVGNCTNTLKQDPASKYNPPIGIMLYRNTNGGSTFYQVYSDTGALISDPNTVSQSVVEGTSDANLPGLGYGTWPYSGGALEGYCPPSLQKIVAYNLRLWGIGDDRKSLWYTTALLEGEQPRFNDAWRMSIGDRIVGLEVLDNVLYVLTASGILRIAGNGPNEENTQNDLQGPDIVPSDVGCIESRSIVSTPLGIFFQAQPGLYLLGRGGADVTFVGAPVEDTLAANPVIKAATLHPAKTEVRFECAPTETSTTGVTLVYNYTFKAWSVFQRTDGDAALASAAAISATTANDVYYWGVSGGRVYQESSTSYLDGLSWVTLRVDSAWAKGGPVQGWARFKYANVIVTNAEAHDLTVQVATDFESTWDQAHTFTASEMATWTTPKEAAEIHIGKQKAAALRVRIQDAAPTGLPYTTGQGPILFGLQLEVAMMGRPYRMPPLQGA